MCIRDSMDTEDEEKKKARKREADEDLIAAKWKNRMIGTVSYTHLDVYKRQT